MNLLTRRAFLHRSAIASAAIPPLLAQMPGARPLRDKDVTVLNPRDRVPVGLIIDDSTCLVNLNRFAMPQFDAAYGGANKTYLRDWKSWPTEIPDSFVREFGEWCAAQGVKGKYSIVPYPACVGRVDRVLPGWSEGELKESLALVRELMMPNWDIHPEMVTHTRVIDLKTGHPYPDHSLRFMENWDWTTGKSADEIGSYLAYALDILKNAGLPCEGVTTPGGFGNRALPELAQATLQACRRVFQTEIPHYFRHLYSEGAASVAPRVEYASDLEGADPRCVVSIIGCTGDWTGGWDNTTPVGVDAFISQDLERGRMVEVIGRGEPAMMVCHWTGIHWNGQKLGFKIFQEVVRRLRAKYDNLLWMKLSELARYWAAKELTKISREGSALTLHAPFACPDFTLRCRAEAAPKVSGKVLAEVASPRKLLPGTWTRQAEDITLCFPLPKGASRVDLA